MSSKISLMLPVLLSLSACAGPLKVEDFVTGSYTCSKNNPTDICLGIKYVSYKNSDPVISQTQVESDLDGLNKIWSPCGISFTLSKYELINPDDYGLKFKPSSMNEMADIRLDFDEASSFLIVATGKWDRSGDLGQNSANAWTNLPQPNFYTYGVVLEAPVDSNPFLGLNHINNKTNVMNPIVYYNSELNESECQQAKLTAQNYWTKAYQ